MGTIIQKTHNKNNNLLYYLQQNSLKTITNYKTLETKNLEKPLK